MNEQSSFTPSPAKTPEAGDRRNGLFLTFLLVLLPLCCGLPLVVGGLAVASAAIRGVVVGLLVAAVGAVAVLLLRRRRKRRENRPVKKQ
jgi:membrane protein implicated in regulation of membrane protease activity